jgi:hypothetical protein
MNEEEFDLIKYRKESPMDYLKEMTILLIILSKVQYIK